MSRSMLFFMLLGLPLSSAETPELSSRLVEASLFKNGHAFLVREVEVPKPGIWSLRDLPQAIHGTFWIWSMTPGLTVLKAESDLEDLTEKASATNLAQVLMLNEGKKLELKLAGEGWVSCEILSVPRTSAPNPIPPRYGRHEESSWSSLNFVRPAPPESQAAGLVLLKTDKGILALSISEISAIRSNDAFATETKRTQREAVLRLQTSGGPGKVRVVCLGRGLSWAPSYAVDISDPKTARVSAKAVVVNDAEKLSDTNLQCVMGFPHLQFIQTMDALTPGQSLSSFLQSLQNRGGSSRSPVVTQQMIMTNVASFDASTPLPVSVEEGESREDLYFYPLKAVNLAQGARGYYPLSDFQVPYQSVFTWEIPDTLDEHDRWRDEDRSSKPNPEEIWHELKLKHPGGIPWSTGPAMTLQEGRLLGQDTLYFTPSGGETRLRITRAMEIVAERKESETHRQRDVQPPTYGHWDLVTVKGEMQVVNRKNKAITLLVRKRISGDLGTFSHPPKIQTQVVGLRAVNQRHVLSWELPLAAHEKLRLSYTYKVLVNRN